MEREEITNKKIYNEIEQVGGAVIFFAFMVILILGVLGAVDKNNIKEHVTQVCSQQK